MARTNLSSRLARGGDPAYSIIALLLDTAQALPSDLLQPPLLLLHALAGALGEVRQAFPPALLLKGYLPLQPLRLTQCSADSSSHVAG